MRYNESQSKSYNRSTGIHKRAFALPNAFGRESQDSFVYTDNRQFGRSASHGFDRHFRTSQNSNIGVQPQYEFPKCELKFNKKSANYDMSEIELPAYCKNHHDGKLLYIITPDGQESELGCIHCTMSIKKSNIKHSVVEVKDKLDDYIDHASQMLYSNKSKGTSAGADPHLVSKIHAFKDKEIARVAQYYEQVMKAIAEERDNQIAEITEIAEQNIAQVSGSSYGYAKPQKNSKVDIKLNNFCIELGKVVEGVDETGIHIKELWKINQDYKDVVSQKSKENYSQSQTGEHSLLSFEFHTAQQEKLKDLAKRIGQVVTQTVSSDYFLNNYTDSSQSRNYVARNFRNPSYDAKIENIPTFGIGSSDESRKYTHGFKYEAPAFGESSQNRAFSHSPNRDYKYNNQYSKYNEGQNFEKSNGYEKPNGYERPRDFQPTSSKYSRYESKYSYDRAEVPGSQK